MEQQITSLLLRAAVGLFQCEFDLIFRKHFPVLRYQCYDVATVKARLLFAVPVLQTTALLVPFHGPYYN